MLNFATQSLQDLQQQVPIISDKVLVDLVNGIQVNDDLIRFRQNRGFIGRLFDGVTGSDRQILIDSNLNVGIKSLHQWILALADNLRISNVALEITQTKLLETRNALRNYRQEIDILKQITEHLQIQLQQACHATLLCFARAAAYLVPRRLRHNLRHEFRSRRAAP